MATLEKLLGITTPIVGAPMAGPAGGLMAARVTQAGGFGFIGAGFSHWGRLPLELAIANKELAFSNDGKKQLQVGAGFITFELIASGKKSESPNKWPLLDTALDNRVAAVWFSFGDATELVAYVRKRSPDTKIFAQVQTVEEAVQAVNEWKVDVLVVQGSESGGHGAVSSMPTFTFLTHVVRELASISPKVPILAAGGIMTGEQLNAAMAIGAAGVVVGTALLASHESLYTPQQKEAIIKAKDGTETVRTFVFDVARGFVWPEQWDGRALKNKTTEQESSITPENLDEFRQKYNKALEQGDVSICVVWAGQGVGLVKESKSVAEVIHQIAAEANKTK